MFNKKQLKVDLYESSKVSHKTKIKGKISSKNDFRLDGIFNGKLTCEKSVIIGKNGVEKIVELNLSESEKMDFNKSIDSVKELFNAAIKIDSKLGV